MQEKPKVNKETIEENCDRKESGMWAEDQKRRSYYYDDAHGYEVYDPENDEDEGNDSPIIDERS